MVTFRLGPKRWIGSIEGAESERDIVANFLVDADSPVTRRVVDVPIPLEISLVGHDRIIELALKVSSRDPHNLGR